MSKITSGDNIYDSRDIHKEAEDLREEKQDLLDKLAEAKDAIEDEAEDCGEQEQEAHKEELKQAEEALKEFDEDSDTKALLEFDEDGANNCVDWRHGETVIRESYFEDYCRGMLADVGDLPKDLPHYIVIDWAATADNLKADYSSIEFDGETYLVRSC